MTAEEPRSRRGALKAGDTFWDPEECDFLPEGSRIRMVGRLPDAPVAPLPAQARVKRCGLWPREDGSDTGGYPGWAEWLVERVGPEPAPPEQEMTFEQAWRSFMLLHFAIAHPEAEALEDEELGRALTQWLGGDESEGKEAIGAVVGA